MYLGHLLHFQETVEPSAFNHSFDLSVKPKALNPHFCICYASLKATTVSSYNSFGYWAHFRIL